MHAMGPSRNIEIKAVVAATPGPDDAARGRKLFSQAARFSMGVTDSRSLPRPGRKEVCFCGRSNVGKSSLINALTRQGKLARISKTPGRTQQLNYFTLGTSHYLVDVPGYGYAKMPKSVRAKGKQLLFDYLRGRASLSRVFLLLDSRHLVTPTDRTFLEATAPWGVPLQIVLTKSDLAKSRSEQRTVDRLSQAMMDFPHLMLEVIVTSAKRGKGLDALKSTIATLA